MKRVAVLVAIAAVAACASRGRVPGAGDPYSPQRRLTDSADYRGARARLIEQDRATRLGAGLVLTGEEEAANRRLLTLKQAELDRTREYFPPAHSFLESRVKQLMEQSPVLEVMRRLPKGGILHAHGGAIGDFRWLVAQVTSRPDAYIYLGDGPQPPRGSLRIAAQSPGDGWRPITQARAAANDRNAFDEDILRSITFGEEDRTTPDVWAEFGRCFQRVSGLFADRSLYDEYWRRLLSSLIDENVQYLESRSLPIDHAIVREAQRRDPDFDVNFIVAAGRSGTRERIAQTLDAVLNQRAKDPRIVGFDLVEEEERTHSNLFFLEEILAARREAQRRALELPLYLHSGETNSAENENVYDAVLLGAARIGHGLALIKHPLLMQIVKQRGIAIEICPISNQVLGFVPDLRNHPAVHYINAGLPIVLATDDPAIMQHSLSHDFYVAFMAWGLDLRSLKQIAMNSLVYSAMNADKKRQALASWNQRWDRFVTWLNSNTP